MSMMVRRRDLASIVNGWEVDGGRAGLEGQTRDRRCSGDLRRGETLDLGLDKQEETVETKERQSAFINFEISR